MSLKNQAAAIGFAELKPSKDAPPGYHAAQPDGALDR